ncbi:ribonuclease H-like protein [Aspergillus heteromorphus CBS 117.55]|uniref:Ribonuclease H-like protein n=1 Tax=Aspergillus heteromorphus CBS 117.55 TaxID=1448321 RepID=A0A317W5G6_9EURO|nr:ribonuclease H-like protein [Aspergillus heteromorphus CBS 117.55]PWY80572.1 ribonuclease H-like protein [Aspergillus heteromorphus CBS 117.55]
MTQKQVSKQSASAGAGTHSCPACQKSKFKTAAALKDHQLSLGHGITCEKCKRVFKDSHSLAQHQVIHKPTSTTNGSPPKKPVVASNGPGPKQPVVVAASPPALPIVLPLSYQSTAMGESNNLIPAPTTTITNPIFNHPQTTHHTYTLLDTPEQNLIFRYLLARCHPLARLKSQGYTMSTNTISGHRPVQKSIIPRNAFRHAPPFLPQAPDKRKAVVIDCEMVQVSQNRRELAFLSAVDFLTGDVLINRYVKPSLPVTDWKTAVSGITAESMATALMRGEAFRGWEEARQALWAFVDDETVLIGHSLNSDLSVLGMIHVRVVDSAIFTAEIVFLTLLATQPLKRVWGLKTLVKELLDYDIQSGSQGHDALEDAFATRDLVIWCLRNPELLKLWADRAREEHRVERERQSSGRRKGGNGRARNAKEMGNGVGLRSPLNILDSDGDSESEILRWEDIAVDCGWPHPDTGYDPWSD